MAKQRWPFLPTTPRDIDSVCIYRCLNIRRYSPYSA
uniref:Transposase n=1 Tax=Ascaris lumbricoides TaxID=6252 RepID=A0A0M3HL62_ASCLU